MFDKFLKQLAYKYTGISEIQNPLKIPHFML
jgi:hypothetical protein